MDEPTTLGELLIKDEQTKTNEQIKKFEETMDRIIESLKQLEQDISNLIDAMPNDIDPQE